MSFLYLGENLAHINVNEYIERLVDDIKELYISNNTYIEMVLEIDKMEFSINRCIQVGMLIHELCVNSFKYAFKDNKQNLLTIYMKLKGKNIHMQLKDNGDGLKSIESLKKSDSIGMQLIHSIVDFQLQGKIEFRNNNGLECNITFPKKGGKMKKNRILIVEDEPIIALNLKQVLSELGYEPCGIANNRCNTMKLLNEQNIEPDLILMDIYLQGPTTGIVLARELKELLPNTPVNILNSKLRTCNYKRGI